MEPGQPVGARLTPQLLKARSGEFALDSILLLKLRGLGLADLGCLGECLGLEWLDVSGNKLTHLGPLAGLRQLAVLNVAGNRLASLEPLAACERLQSLNAAGNLLASPRQLQCLSGLQALEQLRLRDPLARLSNPLCAGPDYRAAVLGLLPRLRALDGQRVGVRGGDLDQLCRDLDGPPEPHATPTLPPPARPWVPSGYWEPAGPESRTGSILDEACRQFQDSLRECRELDLRAGDSLARAQRALGPALAPAAPGTF